MNKKGARMECHLSKNRLETLVDGIFAIAMTILVLGITPPKPDVSQAQAVLTSQIFNLIPQFFLFGIAFLILSSFWLNHHRHFHFVRAVDPRLLWINIFLLIFIVLIPFSTDVGGDYPGVQTAVLLFHINILIVGIILSYHLYYISQSEHLCDTQTDKEFLRVQFNHSLLLPGMAFTAGIFSFIYPSASLLVYLVVPVIGYFLHW